jgi:NitT/TauT family transport system permease protein
VLAEFGGLLTTTRFWEAMAITMQRIAAGFALAIAVGAVIGVAVSRSELLRRAIGSIITGLQSMPSIVWFPFAILVFGLSEAAILFVIVLGAAPAIANGLIAGVDHIPPILLRAGKVLGARGLAAWRHVVLPAALPAFVSGLKQGWAFAWRSLMAGELLVRIASRPSIGVRLDTARELSDASGLMAMMLVVLLIGILVDSLLFGSMERRIRRNRGLLASGAVAALR